MENITHKDLYYEFEHEVRAVYCPAFDAEAQGATGYAENMIEVDGQLGFYAYAPPMDVAGLVEGIVLHPSATPTFEGQMAQVCKAAGLPAPARSRRLARADF